MRTDPEIISETHRSGSATIFLVSCHSKPQANVLCYPPEPSSQFFGGGGILALQSVVVYHFQQSGDRPHQFSLPSSLLGIFMMGQAALFID